MKYLDEYRDPAWSLAMLDEIRAAVTRPWTLMEICGGQTHSIMRHGLDEIVAAGGGVGAWTGLPRVRHPAWR